MSRLWRFAPFARFDRAGAQAYLESMAARGWFLKRLSYPLCVFRSGQPARLRYRLEPVRKEKEPSAELLDIYQSAGWEYVTFSGAFFIFSAADPEAAEPYSDGESLAQAMAALTKAMKSTAIRQMIVLLFFAALFAVAAIMGGGARLPLILMELPLTGLVWLVWSAVGNIKDWLALRRMRHLLAEGGSPLQLRPSRGQGLAWRNAVYSFLSIVVLCWVLASFVLGRVAAAPPAGLHYPPLAGLEQQYHLDQVIEDVERERGRTFFLPFRYRADQTGYGPEIDRELDLPATGYGRTFYYAPSLDMTYFRLSLPFLARTVARAQMDMYHAVNLNWTYSEAEYPGVDFVLLGVSDRHSQLAAIGFGNELVVYRYNGAEQLAEHLDLLAGLLADE